MGNGSQPESQTDNPKNCQFIRKLKATTFCEPVGVSFTWSLKEFSKCACMVVSGPEFKFLDSTWSLKLKISDLGITLVRINSDNPVYYVKYWISLQDIKGSNHFTCFRNELFNSVYHSGKPVSFDKEFLNEKKEEFLVDDTLTIVCELVPLLVRGHSPVTQTMLDIEDGKVTGATRCLPALSKDFEVMLKAQKFSDVKIVVGKTEFPVHKVVLGSRSPVFSAMFDQHMLESKSSIVNITDIEERIVEELLRYIYTGNVSVLSLKDSLDLYVAADKYCLEELKSVCAQYIVSGLNESNFYDIGVMADRHDDDVLNHALKDFFLKNEASILESKEWKILKKERPNLCVEILEYVRLSERETH